MSKLAKQWAHRQQIADGAMKPVLVELAYLHMAGRDIFPSQAHLALATGNSERTVRDALRLLEMFGVVKRTRRSKGAAGRTTDLFALAMDKEFSLTKTAIAAVRKSFSNRRNLPVAEPESVENRNRQNPSSQPAKSAGGIGREQKIVLSHVEYSEGSKRQYTREEPTGGPQLRLVSGGTQ